jgi:hypothetical protein
VPGEGASTISHLYNEKLNLYKQSYTMLILFVSDAIVIDYNQGRADKNF